MESRKTVAAALALVVLATAGHARCNYCNETVTLTDMLAQCYLEGIDEQLQQAQQFGMPTTVFDLSACPGAPEQTGSDRSLGLPVPRVASGTEAEPVSLRFIVDLATAGCLAEMLRLENFDPEKIKTFDLSEHCGDAE